MFPYLKPHNNYARPWVTRESMRDFWYW